MTIWRVRTPCWINKAADTRSEYVILIVLPRQQMLLAGTSVLRLDVHCLSFCLQLCVCIYIYIFIAYNIISVIGICYYIYLRNLLFV